MWFISWPDLLFEFLKLSFSLETSSCDALIEMKDSHRSNPDSRSAVNVVSHRSVAPLGQEMGPFGYKHPVQAPGL